MALTKLTSKGRVPLTKKEEAEMNAEKIAWMAENAERDQKKADNAFYNLAPKEYESYIRDNAKDLQALTNIVVKLSQFVSGRI